MRKCHYFLILNKKPAIATRHVKKVWMVVINRLTSEHTEK